MRPRGQADARDLPGDGDQGHPGRVRRPALRLRRDRRLRRLRLVRGRPGSGVRHREDDGAGARVLAPRRPAQSDDQDPRHRRGRPGDRGDDLRGAEHQRHAPLRGRRVRARRRGVHPGPRAPPRRGQERRDAVGRVVLRLARGHRGRQAPRGRRSRRPPGQGRTRERARRLPALQGDLPRRPLRAGARGGRVGAAPAVGVDRREEPEVPRHALRRRARRPGDRQHDADGDAARRRGSRDGRRQHGRHRPRPGPARARGGGHRPRRRHRQAAARRRRQVRRADGQAARGHRPEARGDRHLAPADDPGADPRRHRAADRRARAPRDGRRRRPPHLEEGRHAVGPGRPGRGLQPARLADDRRHDARGARRPRVLRRGDPRRGLHRRRAARHGRLVARARGHPPVVRRAGRLAVAARPRLDRRPRSGRSRSA